MADVGCGCLGSLRPAGQDGEMADAVFETVRSLKAKGMSWKWQCMSVVLALVIELKCRHHLFKQQLSSQPPNAPGAT